MTFFSQARRTTAESTSMRSESERHVSHPVRNISAPVPLKPRCACGGGCPRCQWGAANPAGLRLSAPGDRFEQEADRTTDRVMRMPDSGLTPRDPYSFSGPSSASSARSGGEPLPLSVRAFFEPRFNHDFADVRVHTDANAIDSARAVNAKAYTIGNDIVFNAGRYAPAEPSGKRLLAHELAHVAQQSTVPSGSTMLWRDADDLTRRARYPTAEERQNIQGILNPQQQQAAQQGTTVAQVTDPAGFQTDMTTRMDNYINAALPSAQQRQSSTVALGQPEIESLGDVAQPAVQTFYGRYLSAAVHSQSETQRRAGYQLRQHLHLVPTTQSAQTDDTARDWVASRMLNRGPDILESYHVLAGQNARDQALFIQVRDHIFSQRTNDLRTIVLFHPGYEGGGEAYIQSHIAPDYSTQPAAETRRRGRWSALGTTIHEMLHAVAHENFSSGVAGLEESGIAVEGFAEYFTKPVYDDLVERARNDDALRTSIEGTQGSFVQPPDRDPGTYQRYVDGVTQIRDLLGGNEESLKVAFFLGRLDYIGLGGWNEATAARLRFPGNVLGVAALLTNDERGFFQVDYARVLVGRSRPFQVQIGAGINYLTQGERFGLTANTALQYSWPNVYLRGGVGVGASAGLRQPFTDSVRLDVIPGVEAGVRIGIVRAGVRSNLLIPVAGGPVSERVVHVGVGLGLSLDL